MSDRLVAIVVTLVNLSIPGVGSLIGRVFREGSLQLVLTALAAVFVLFEMPTPLVGIAAVSAWLWALQTSVTQLKVAFIKPIELR